MAPTLACVEVDGDDAVDAGAATVGDVGDAGAGGGDMRAEVDAEVVQVGFGVGDVAGEGGSGEYCVVGEVDADEFGAAYCRAKKGTRGRVYDAADVVELEAVEGVDYHTLHGDDFVGAVDGGG